MRLLLIILITYLPIYSLAQEVQDESQTIDQYHFKLQKVGKGVFQSVQIGSTDTFRLKLDGIIYSTGNPLKELHFQMTDKNNGFIYGNEVGYGVWPFLFRTSDGGKSWTRLLFKKVESGTNLLKDHLYMFNQKKGILMYNADNTKNLLGKRIQYFQYYLTTDGGHTWQKKKVKLKRARGLRVENNHYFMHCAYTPKGTVNVAILKSPWASAEGKREIKDRVRLLLTSQDYGKTFTEALPK